LPEKQTLIKLATRTLGLLIGIPTYDFDSLQNFKTMLKSGPFNYLMAKYKVKKYKLPYNKCKHKLIAYLFHVLSL